MAVTVADLLEDIEKRMIALGYDDFENLYSPDHDLQSLKEIKRKLMDEAKALREEKKAKTRWTKEFRDVLVKISKIYKKDLYIYNGSIVIPGKISEESLKGKFIISIRDEYKECMKRILFNNFENSVIFIRDLSELKSVVDENIDNETGILPMAEERNIIEILDADNTSKYINQMNDELEKIQQDSEDFIELLIDNSDEEILSMKKLFEIKYKDFPPIIGNIQLFPFITEKEQPRVEFMCHDFNDNGNVKLYYARFHVDYSYFDIYFKIYFF